MIAQAVTLLLLTDGNVAQAIDRIAQFDAELSETRYVTCGDRCPCAVGPGRDCGEQYAQHAVFQGDVKEELNRVTFEHNKRHPV